MGTFRVLVADDHRLMLAAVRRALAAAEDFEIVSEVSVGSRVLPVVRETNPDVVLLDMRMPELDGLTCLARLRKHDPTIAVVILSSYDDEAQHRGCAGGRRARLHRQDDRAGGSPGGAPERALGPTLCGLGRGGGAERRFDRNRGPERARDASFSRRWRAGCPIERSVASSGSASRPSSSTCATCTGSSASRAGPRRLDTPTGRASSLR